MKNTTKNKLVKTIACITTCFLCFIPQTIYADTDYVNDNIVAQSVKTKHANIFLDLLKQNQIVFDPPNECEYKACSINERRQNEIYRNWLTGSEQYTNVDASYGFVLVSMDEWLLNVSLEGEKPYTWKYLDDQYSELMIGTQVSSAYYKAFLDYQNWLVYEYNIASNYTNIVNYIQGTYISFKAYAVYNQSPKEAITYNDINAELDLVNENVSFFLPQKTSGWSQYNIFFISNQIDIVDEQPISFTKTLGAHTTSDTRPWLAYAELVKTRDVHLQDTKFYRDNTDTAFYDAENGINFTPRENLSDYTVQIENGLNSGYTGPCVLFIEISVRNNEIYGQYDGSYKGSLSLDILPASSDDFVVPITTRNINNTEITNNQYIVINDDHSTTIYNIDNSVHTNIEIQDNSEEITVINELNDKINEIEDDYLIKLNNSFQEVDLQQLEPNDEITNGLGLVKHIMTKTIDTYTDSNIAIVFILPLILAIILMVIK